MDTIIFAVFQNLRGKNYLRIIFIVIYIISKQAFDGVIALDNINFTVDTVEIVVYNFRFGQFKTFCMQNFITLSAFKELMANINRLLAMTARLFPKTTNHT